MMNFIQNFKNDLFKINPQDFNGKALALFRYQAANNALYKQYLKHLHIDIDAVSDISQIPFLPISFFKHHKVLTGSPDVREVFLSSGTTGAERSRHYVPDPEFYKKVSVEIFSRFYGPVKDCIFIALLPSYQENPASSLIFMINHFMQESAELSPGFLPKDYSKFPSAIQEARSKGKKIFLFGVAFALLDLAHELKGMDLSGIVIIETGGMKGRREEMTREELHEILKNAFNSGAIHSEYGMTELLSQAYARGNGVFECPPWMKIFIRDINDPFSLTNSRNGGINIVDLANADSCAFIETEDVGRKISEAAFEVLGRFDNSDIRGCNLLYLS
jgi:phenylacetate-coenzyme A ligase PaaK-like adenylate-forming protein